MDKAINFCTACGRNLEPGMQFCPQCGQMVPGSDAEAELKSRASDIDAFMRESRLNWILFAVAMYAIPVTIFGLMALLDAGATADMVWSNSEFQNWLSTHGYSVTVDDVRTYLLVAAGTAFGSGLCALVSMACVIKRRMWKLAVVACFLAAVLCCWSIFGFFIGMMMTWLIYSVKDAFS